jgi:2-dehydropantoate 2-reductase
MKICIYGAGAIGGYLGVQLAQAGADVSLVARGPHLAAMRANGLKLLIGDKERVVRPRCTDNPAELGPQDFVIVCLKAHSITGVIEAMQPLLGPRTRIVTAINGIPYWYFYKHGGRYEGSTLESIDPGGRQWRELAPQRAIGCIVYPATEIEAPGVIRHVYGDRFPIGEPSGETSSDVERLSALFVAAGMQAPVLDRIRDEIWLKLWGNVCLNPISALTYATLDVICSDPATRALSKAIMLETQAIAETFGVKFRVDVERRIEGARKVGAHKTSMLQDLERGRPMEIDPLVTVVQEMERLTQTPTPALDAVLALVAQRAKIAGLYGDDRRPMQAKSPVFCMIALPWPLRCPVDICRARRHPDFENSKQHGTRAVAPRRGKVRGPA